MRQLTEKEAIAFCDNKCWESMTLEDRAQFQLNQRRLCMPFDVFHEAIEKLLKRPVYTHEFAYCYEDLIKEANGLKKAPTFEEICNMIPKEKLRIVFIEKDITPECNKPTLEEAAEALVEAVELYLKQGILRSELIIKKDNLKKLLNNVHKN